MRRLDVTQPILLAMLLALASRTSPTAPTPLHLDRPSCAARCWGQSFTASPIISTVYSAAATAAVVSTEVVAVGTVTVDGTAVIPAGKITSPRRATPTVSADSRVKNHVVSTRPGPNTTARRSHALSPHVVTSTIIRPSCSTPAVVTRTPRTKIATVATAAVGLTNVGGGAAVIVSACTIPHAATAATVAANGRVHDGIIPTRAGPETTAHHRHALSLHVNSTSIRPSFGIRHLPSVETGIPRNNAAATAAADSTHASIVTLAKATAVPRVTEE